MKKFLALLFLTGLLGSVSAQEPLLAPILPDESVRSNGTTLGTPEAFPPSVEVVPPSRFALPSRAVEPPLESRSFRLQDFSPPTRSLGAIDPGFAYEPGAIVCDSVVGHRISLYPKVRVRDARKIAPHAVRKIVAVPDPCGGPRCVFIEICVPSCACEHVSFRRGRLRYDYGRFAIDISHRRQLIVVDYDD
ncbi:MAG: hypothetical protein KDA80_20965 [Planctomycetaceae bacterium]|nr:hypothetical protein [Planctomycetaceae bacterium]